MLIDIDKIYVPLQKRLRQDYGDLAEFSKSFPVVGQVSSVVVRPYDPARDDPDETRFEWTLDDGGRRIITVSTLHEKGTEIPGVPPGKIKAELKDDIPRGGIQDLLVEFFSNDGKRFEWRETASFVRQVHAYLGGLAEENGEQWSVALTAAFLKWSENTVYQYLQLTQDEEVFEDQRVQMAATFKTAVKQSKMVRDQKRRQKVIEHIEQQEKDTTGAVTAVASSHSREVIAASMARGILWNGDSRDWAKQIKDGEFGWFHWDPPYGGDQDGGAFTSFERINDSWSYAKDLHSHMVPEIHRMLADGHWLAIWTHQSSSKQEYMRRLLQGHDVGVRRKRKSDPENSPEHLAVCIHCGKPWIELDAALPCPKAKTPFWVNPYANIWFKIDRTADGHEITRYLRNDYETFLLAAKWEDTEPILPQSNVGNVFDEPVVPKSERRHIMQKPVPLLKRVLSIISIPGEMGGDAGAGSGTIIEAALESNRRIKACELSKGHWTDAITATKEKLLSTGIV